MAEPADKLQQSQSNAHFDNRVLRLLLIASLPSYVLLIGLMWFYDWSLASLLLVTLLLGIGIFVAGFQSKQLVAYQLRTLANLVEALRVGDYSQRGRSFSAVEQQSGDKLNPLYELTHQLNLLSERLNQQRLEVKEHQLLLGKIIENIDIALVAIDQTGKIKIVNQAFANLNQQSVSYLQHKTLQQLSLQALLEADINEPLDWQFPSGVGRFTLYREQFFEDGTPHQLLLIKDIKSLLRNEEQQAWSKLIRVISHEINNSLAPIASLSGTLKGLISQADKTPQLIQGLDIIQERATNLGQLVNRYKQLAKHPAPNFAKVELNQLVNNVVTLHAGINIAVEHMAAECWINADQGQIEQVLINLIKNADESQQTQLGKKTQLPALQIKIDALTETKATITLIDSGTGISNPQNLFVPFYSTKTNGSGIGLFTCQQIVEAHSGELTLSNRETQQGCIAKIVLPR